jgi:uncharacterized protein (DUF4415 family)
MKNENDFSNGKQGAVLGTKNKTRVTMYLDNDVLDAFRGKADELGKGYQTLINETLRERITGSEPIDAKSIRKIIREELKRTGT